MRKLFTIVCAFVIVSTASARQKRIYTVGSVSAETVYTVVIDEEGEYQGYAYREDNVGNRSETHTVHGYIDNTPPEVSIVPRRSLTIAQGERYTSSGNRFVVRAGDRLGTASIVVELDFSVDVDTPVPEIGAIIEG